MPFTWVQDVSSGAILNFVDLDEFRDNADYVKDNLCTNHNPGYQETVYLTDNPTLLTGYNPSYLDTYQGDHDDPMETGAYSGANPGYYPGALALPHNTGDDANNKVGVDSAYNTTNYSSVLGSYDGSYNPGYMYGQCNFHDNSEDGTAYSGGHNASGHNSGDDTSYYISENTPKNTTYNDTFNTGESP